MNETHKLRCGDIVRLKATDEVLVVGYADYARDRLSWYGWPNGEVRIGDVELIEACSDEEHAEAVAQWLDRPGGGADHRVRTVRRLYRPAEHRAVMRRERRQRMRQLCQELARLVAEELADEEGVTDG